MMGTLLQDLRYGVRVLRQKPGFTAVAVLALGLGIGVNSAILSTVNTMLLRPVVAERPEELAHVFIGSKKDLRVYDDFSYPDYLDLRDQNKAFSGLIARSMTSVALSRGESRGLSAGRAEVITGEVVTGNYFDVLGVRPRVGRGFLPEEGRTPNTHPVVVLSHALWQRSFNSDPALVGTSVYLNGHPFTVIGIAPPEFKGTKFALGMDFWVPIMMYGQLQGDDTWQTNREMNWWLSVFGRLKPGVTTAQAEADLKVIAEGIAKLHPKTSENTKINVVPENEGRLAEVFPIIRLSSLLAMAVAGLVLLIACANVANLLLARAAARGKEIGIRLALGAGRWRIIRQLLTESVLLALAGGGLGLALAYRGADLMEASVPPIPFVLDLPFTPDVRVLGWTLGISLLTGLVFGLAPAWHAARTDLVPVLKGDAASAGARGRRRGLRNLLVIAQIAISIIVLVCAGMFLRSLYNARSVDVGFQTDNLVSMSLNPELLGYKEAEGKKLYAELTERLNALPGVSSATASQLIPLSDNNYSTGPLIVEGQEPPPPNQGLYVSYSSVGTRYFETMGTQLLVGRDFTDRDRDGAPEVVIVNQELARRLFGGSEQALGKRFRIGDTKRPPLEIVGVARDGKYRTLFEDPRPYMFLPHQQRFYWSWASLIVRVKSSGDLKAVTDGMRREVQTLDARLPVFDIKTADQHLSWAFWGPRVGAGMALTFGLLALVLATTGLYSVMTYAVSQRTREIGIRMALGAGTGNVLRLVISQGMLLVAIGVGAGLVAALALSRVLTSLLLGVGAGDPITFIAVALLLSLVALAACYIPARRATKTDPMIALRYE